MLERWVLGIFNRWRIAVSDCDNSWLWTLAWCFLGNNNGIKTTPRACHPDAQRLSGVWKAQADTRGTMLIWQDNHSGGDA
jgi:hypothetical protein